LGGRASDHRLSPLVVYNGGEYIGNADDFYVWAQSVLRYPGKAPNPVLYNQVAKSEYSKFLDSSVHAYAYMNVTVAGGDSHRVVFELYKDVCPRTGVCSQACPTCSPVCRDPPS
jgi:hypothetical protein